MLNSKAITKIQSILIICTVLISGFIGGLAYALWTDDSQSVNSIKIGVCADLDMLIGVNTHQGVLLAAEQLNAEGGILGRTIEVIAEDSDASGGDTAVGVAALTRLLTFHKVDYIISSDGSFLLSYQDIVSNHDTILFGLGSISNELTQRVIDDYQKYKNFFRVYPNATHALLGTCDCLNTLRDYSGFNKVAILVNDIPTLSGFVPILENSLTENFGFEIVYSNTVPMDNLDFSSYLSAIESSGAEIFLPWIISPGGIAMVNEWFDRQSPFVIWGVNVYTSEPDGWESTGGKCEHNTNVGAPIVTGYPISDLTLQYREAFTERWGEPPESNSAYAYDTLRFILADALERAQTTEVEEVIRALEDTSIETSLARNFVFTSSHDTMGGININNPGEDHLIVMLFQWQNGQQLPMYPKHIKEEAGATYTFPDWPGPWDNIS